MKRIFLLFSFLWFAAAFACLTVRQYDLLGTRKITDFSTLLPQDVVSDNSWYGIYFQGKFIGYSNYYMRMRDFQEGGGYLLRTISRLAINLLGRPEDLTLSTQLTLDKSYLLERASFSLNSSVYFIHQDIERVAKDKYRLHLTSPSQDMVKELTMKGDLLSSLFLPVNIHYVPLGKKVSLSFFDPLLDKKRQVSLENKGKVSLALATEELTPYHWIEMEAEGLRGDLYVDDKGLLIKANFLGFEFIREDLQEVIPKGIDLVPEELLHFFSIETGRIADPLSLTALRVRIDKKGMAFKEEEFRFFNQTAEGSGEGVVVRTEKTGPYAAGAKEAERADHKEYLGEDDFIKTDDPLIRRIIEEAAASESDPFEVLKALSSWIDLNIKKVPTFSIPNTLDVLTLRQGDCGELSALLTGLLRAKGIPSYVNIGLVYQEGRFYYHAWPSVYVGRWIDTDPALSQLIADATHIKFFKGLKSQFEITKMLGELEVVIIKEEYD